MAISNGLPIERRRSFTDEPTARQLQGLSTKVALNRERGQAATEMLQAARL
jgi:hypothetical protein